MSTTTTTRAKVRKLVVAGAAAAAVAVPLTMVAATPAEAATRAGCTVTPLRPVQVGVTGAGVPIFRYDTRVTCARDRIVQIRDQRYEWDAPAGVGNDEFYGQSGYLLTFAVAGTRVVSTRDVVTNTEAGWEETYHRTSFRVATINGVTGWTAFQNSALAPAAI